MKLALAGLPPITCYSQNNFLLILSGQVILSSRDVKGCRSFDFNETKNVMLILLRLHSDVTYELYIGIY